MSIVTVLAAAMALERTKRRCLTVSPSLTRHKFHASLWLLTGAACLLFHALCVTAVDPLLPFSGDGSGDGLMDDTGSGSGEGSTEYAGTTDEPSSQTEGREIV